MNFAALVPLGLIFLLPGLLGARFARLKGRNPLLWFLFCACLPPALFLLRGLPPLREVPGRYRRCAECDALIPWQQERCPECRLTFEANRELLGDFEDEEEPDEDLLAPSDFAPPKSIPFRIPGEDEPPG